MLYFDSYPFLEPNNIGLATMCEAFGLELKRFVADFTIQGWLCI